MIIWQLEHRCILNNWRTFILSLKMSNTMELFKSDKMQPVIIITAAALSALIYRFDIKQAYVFSLILNALIFAKGMKNPWLLLLAAIPLFFSMEPVPVSLGVGESIIVLTLIGYVLGTYYQVFKARQFIGLNYALYGTGIFTILVLFSCWSSLTQQVLFSDWLRGISPYLFLYLIIPISITFENDFEFKIKWLLIAFAIFSLMITCYINAVFFIEHYYKSYWLNTNGTRIFQITDAMNASEWSGPYRDRITLRIQQATSELIPLSFIVFTLVSIYSQKKIISSLAFFCAAISLFTILETFTRSMLISALLVLVLLGMKTLFFDRQNLKKYIRIFSLLMALGVSFIYATNMESIWLGRLSSLASGVLHIKLNESATTQVKNNVDANVGSRMAEYKIAFDMFVSSPITGQGIGVKHDIEFQTTEKEYIHEEVGYVHNVFFYWLMVGGSLGLCIYAGLFYIPLIYFIRAERLNVLLKPILISTLLGLSIYASFFAVFRLFSFNLILALCCGIFLYLFKSNCSIKKSKPS